jgi:hypothetical protein
VILKVSSCLKYLLALFRELAAKSTPCAEFFW